MRYETEPLLRIYRIFKLEFGTERSLDLLKNYKCRAAVAQLRTSSHMLTIGYICMGRCPSEYQNHLFFRYSKTKNSPWLNILFFMLYLTRTIVSSYRVLAMCLLCLGYHMFPWLCVGDVCYIIFCNWLHIHYGKTRIFFHYHCAVYDEFK